jgi:hypothetical protein
MQKSRSLLGIAGALLVLGVVSFLLQPVLDGKPDAECVKESSADGAIPKTSGLVDEDQGGCAISIESYEKINDWDSKPKPFRIAGLVLVLAGLVTGGVALVRGRRAP